MDKFKNAFEKSTEQFTNYVNEVNRLTSYKKLLDDFFAVDEEADLDDLYREYMKLRGSDEN